MALCVVHFFVEFPSAASHLVGTRCDGRRTQRHSRSRKNDARLGDVLNSRNTALELEVYVDHVALGDRRDVHTRLIALLIVVFIDNSNNLIFREVEDVRITRHIERAGLHRNHTMDGEVLLLVG